MAALLEAADFAHGLSLHVRPDGGFSFFPADLAIPSHRERMLTRFNRVALSCAAHTLDFYRGLAAGWETTPTGKATDWHMFQQFLQRADCRCASGTYPSAITFPSPPRLDWSEQQRVAELERWVATIGDPARCQALVVQILEAAVRARDLELADPYAGERQALRVLEELKASAWWRLHERIVAVPGVGALLRRLVGR